MGVSFSVKKEPPFCGLNIEKKRGWTADSELTPLGYSVNTKSRREWQGHVGELLWRVRTSRQQLLECEDLMELFSVIGEGGSKGWDEQLTMSQHHLEMLNHYIEMYSKQQPTGQRVYRRPAVWYYVASDAHLKGEGFVVFKREGDSLTCVAEIVLEFSEKEDQVFREASAAIKAIQFCMTLAKRSGFDVGGMDRVGVVLGVDAESVRFLLEKQYSSKPRMRGLLKEVFLKWSYRHLRLELCRIPGEDNVCDYPSRGRFVYLRPRGLWQPFSDEEKHDLRRRKCETERILLLVDTT